MSTYLEKRRAAFRAALEETRPSGLGKKKPHWLKNLTVSAVALVDRGAVERTVFPYIDLTKRRIVDEMPKAVAERIIARVLTGGDDLSLDVEALIRDECASVYRDCKATTVDALEVFAGD